MPFTLPPLSRRRFLGGSFAAVAGSFLTQRESFAGTETDPSSWIFFSDSHIAADQELVSRDAKMAANLEACVKQALSEHGTAAGVFLSGDCAYLDGKAEDYTTLAGLLKPMREAGLPLHLMMGNHDHRENFLASVNKPGLPSSVEHRVVGLVESPFINWFMLDSLDKTNKTPGLLGPEQRDWLEKSLDAHADKPAIIVVHHNVIPYVPGGEMNKAFEKSLIDSPDLLAILAPRKQVKACFYGHTHNWSVLRETSGIHLINLPPTAYVFKAGMPNGWVHASLRKDGMKLKLNCLDPAHPQNGAAADLAWR
ncbi:MAG: metallophosphoesterase [Verrucomicrobia bacterium]|nr:metallophosphoesterase [Verrucomicrobiota bacterium]